jgi:hypothetical protein
LPAFLLLFGVAAAACAAGPAEERHWRGLLLEIADTRAAPGDAERLWFETPALNAGLPEADSPPNLRTPQAALELFLQAAPLRGARARPRLST